MIDEELWARLEAWEPLVSSGHIVSRAGQDFRQAADRLKALTAALRIAADVLAHLDEQEGDMQASVQFAQAEIRAALEKQPWPMR
jgi:hypothetical protein